jgi:hypothetical protein
MSSLCLKYQRLFRWGDEPSYTEDSFVDHVDDSEVPGIRCPLCKWRPKKSDEWMCWDCDHPEYFYEGCGTEWNTFETQGVCPTCLHQWEWTSCFNCFLWSKHVDWYENDDA